MMNQDVLPPAPQEQLPLPWQRGWRAFKTVWPQLLYISAALIAIPQYLLFWKQSRKAFQLGQSFSLESKLGLPALMAHLKDFSLHYGLLTLLTTILATLGYFSMIALALQLHKGASPSLGQALRSGVQVFFPRHLLNLPLLFISAGGAGLIILTAPHLGLLGQYISITLVVLLAAFPSLMLLEPRQPLRALGSALRLSYAKDTGITRWSVFFVLLSYQMAFIGLLSLIKQGQEQLSLLDLAFQWPRQSWFEVGTWWPFGIFQSLIEACGQVVLGMLLGAFAVFTSSFVFELYHKRLVLAQPRSEENQAPTES